MDTEKLRELEQEMRQGIDWAGGMNIERTHAQWADRLRDILAAQPHLFLESDVDKIGRLMALEKVVELVEKATPGPWLYRDYPMFKHEDIDALLAAVNFIREHGSALIAELGQEVGAVDPVEADNAKAADRAALAMIGKGYYWNGDDWVVSPVHTSEARDSEVKAMDVLSLAELVDAAVCLESCEAAWCGDEMELAAPRRRLAKAYSGLRETLFIAQDALECALRNSKRGSRTNAACSTALEYLRRATKQSDDAAMRQEGGTHE